MKHTRWNVVVRSLVIVCLASLFCSTALARDAKRARQYIESAKERLPIVDWNGAENYLRMATEQAEKTTGAERDALLKEIAQATKAYHDARSAYEKGRVADRIESQLTQSKDYLGDMRQIEQCEGVMETLLGLEENKKLFSPEEMASYRKRFADIKQQSRQKEAAGKAAEAEKLVATAEKELPGIIQRIQKPDNVTDQRWAFDEGPNLFNKIELALKELPQDAEPTKALRARLAKMSGQFDGVVTTHLTGEFVTRITEHWDNLKKEADGWQQETAAPTFAQYVANGLGAPKTEQMLSRAGQWLDYMSNTGDTPPAVLNAPQVKALTAEVTKLRDEARAKLETFAEAVVADAEKAKDLDERHLSSLQRASTGDFENALKGSPKAKPLQERAGAIVQKHEAAAAARAADLKAVEEKLVAAANAAWPAITASIKADEISDPNALRKGQIVKVTGWQNRMGWDFTGSGYDWGVTVNGLPVVGHYAPDVQAAFDAALAKTGGSNIISERMDVIAEVVGPGSVDKRIRHEIRDSGGSTIARGEEWKPVDCLVVKVIAMRAGPCAVGPNGASTESGAIAPVAAAGMTSAGASGASGASGAGWFWRILTLVIGLSAATAALLKAGYAPVAASAQGQQITARLGNDNLAYVGLACAALGVVWLVRGMFLWGLLVSGAIIAAGLYAALDLLLARGILSTHVAERVKPLGVRIGLACATIVVLHLLVGGRLVII